MHITPPPFPCFLLSPGTYHGWFLAEGVNGGGARLLPTNWVLSAKPLHRYPGRQIRVKRDLRGPLKNAGDDEKKIALLPGQIAQKAHHKANRNSQCGAKRVRMICACNTHQRRAAPKHLFRSASGQTTAPGLQGACGMSKRQHRAPTSSPCAVDEESLSASGSPPGLRS